MAPHVTDVFPSCTQDDLDELHALAGWHEYPASPGSFRYWTGESWGEHWTGEEPPTEQSDTDRLSAVFERLRGAGLPDPGRHRRPRMSDETADLMGYVVVGLIAAASLVVLAFPRRNLTAVEWLWLVAVWGVGALSVVSFAVRRPRLGQQLASVALLGAGLFRGVVGT